MISDKVFFPGTNLLVNFKISALCILTSNSNQEEKV